MHDNEQHEFSGIVACLAAAFGVEMSPARFEAFWIGLGDLEVLDVRRAVTQAIREARFMPTPGEIRQLAGAPGASQRAIRAWVLVRQAIRQHGMYESVDFDDPAVNAAVRAVGGWISLCTADTEELDRFRGREFEKAYEGFTRSGVLPREAAALEGMHARECSSTGFLPPPVVRITTGIEPARLLDGPQPSKRALPTKGEPLSIAEVMGEG
jgi:hypothetical protein